MRSTEIEVWKSQTSGEMELVGNGFFFFPLYKEEVGDSCTDNSFSYSSSKWWAKNLKSKLQRERV